MNKLTHFNEQGQAHMVDVGNKNITHRVAIAAGCIKLQASTLQMVLQGNHKKGDVLGIARIAGIMASKQASNLIPLCHPLSLSKVSIEFSIDKQSCEIHCQAHTEVHANTGVEIEALFAVQTALLTIYDMCKAVDRAMCISNVQLKEKSGGKSGHFIAS